MKLGLLCKAGSERQKRDLLFKAGSVRRNRRLALLFRDGNAKTKVLDVSGEDSTVAASNASRTNVSDKMITFGWPTRFRCAIYSV